jgi:hypothetical protein
MSTESTHLRDVAEAGWRWVLGQVRWEDGPRLREPLEPEYQNGFHSGIGGLAYVLAEIRLGREWTADEQHLADAIVRRITDDLPGETGYSFFDGLTSTIGVLTALGAPHADRAVRRLIDIATPDGWAQTYCGPPKFLPGTRINDITLGTAGVLLGAVWAHRNNVAGARELGELTAAILLDEAETLPTGMNWVFIAPRFRTTPGPEMPNFSHGLAGIAATLAVAGAEFGRPDLTDAAALGAEHLVTLGSTDDGFAVPRHLPRDGIDADEFTHNWCHGGAGTSLLFLALDHAGVGTVAGAPPLVWHRRCLRRVRHSGLPARLHPGFWDNDGRCCGTAGVGDIFLDSWQRGGEPDDLTFAMHLADTVAERAITEGDHACWRFVEHRNDEPLLPPEANWGQGAAGIVSFLFRASRIAETGRDAAPVPRMDSWWATNS